VYRSISGGIGSILNDLFYKPAVEEVAERLDAIVDDPAQTHLGSHWSPATADERGPYPGPPAGGRRE
jgi:hypothetical protein